MELDNNLPLTDHIDLHQSLVETFQDRLSGAQPGNHRYNIFYACEPNKLSALPLSFESKLLCCQFVNSFKSLNSCLAKTKYSKEHQYCHCQQSCTKKKEQFKHKKQLFLAGEEFLNKACREIGMTVFNTWWTSV